MKKPPVSIVMAHLLPSNRNMFTELLPIWRSLHSNGRFSGSALLALSKYATILLIACESEHLEDIGVEGRQYGNVFKGMEWKDVDRINLAQVWASAGLF
jgi:hypothetical protein